MAGRWGTAAPGAGSGTAWPARSASIGVAFATSNDPLRVLRRLARCAALSQRRPRSRASARMYVPPPRVMIVSRALIRQLANFPRVHGHANRGERERFTAARHSVRSAAFDLLRGVRRRNLLDRAGQCPYRLAHARDVWQAGRTRGGARHVVGVRLCPERHRGSIHLRLAVQMREQPRCVTHEEYEQPGREGIERARVADSPRTEHASCIVDHVVRRDAGWLVDQQKAVNRSALQWRAVSGRPSRAWCRRLAVHRESARAATRSAPRARRSDRA